MEFRTTYWTRKIWNTLIDRLTSEWWHMNVESEEVLLRNGCASKIIVVVVVISLRKQAKLSLSLPHQESQRRMPRKRTIEIDAWFVVDGHFTLTDVLLHIQFSLFLHSHCLHPFAVGFSFTGILVWRVHIRREKENKKPQIECDKHFGTEPERKRINCITL